MINLSKNIYIVSIVTGLCYSVTALMMITGVLVGYELTHDDYFSTLPIATLLLSAAFFTLLVSKLILRLGFKKGFALSIIIAIIGSCLAIYAALESNFPLFILASVFFGFNASFIRQTRFIAANNSSSEKQRITAISLIAQFCVIGAFLGPYIGLYGEDVISSSHNYSGAFTLLCFVFILALIILLLGYNSQSEAVNVRPVPKTDSQTDQQTSRPLSSGDLLKQPQFLLCVGSSGLAYFITALIACATPIKMLHIDGHSLADTTLVIQTHLIAVFLPSVITANLIKSGLRISLIMFGILLFLALSYMAIGSHDVLQYWFILLLLGFGWNFVYATTTVLLPESYPTHSKDKAQSFNDFIAGTCQGLGALAAGWLLINLHWAGVVLFTFALSFFWLICLVGVYFRNIHLKNTELS